MRREIEFQGALKFTIFHAAALVFCLDAAGYFLAEACASGFYEPRSLVWLLFTALSWWGLGLLFLQRHGPHYRLFGLLLTAVNAVWSVWLLRGEEFARQELLIAAGILCGFGLVIAGHSFLQRLPGGARKATS